MSVARRRLLMGRGGGSYVDDFTVLSSRWDVQAGSLAVSGGALQAATLGDWLGNLIVNGESWTGGPPPTGWNEVGTTTIAVDSNIDPGVASPSLDAQAVKITKTGSADWNRIEQPIATAALQIGAKYHFGAWAYGDPGNARNQGHTHFLDTYSATAPSGEWRMSDAVAGPYATGQNRSFILYVRGTTATGDIDYRDGAFVYRQNAPALLDGWRAPNHIATLSHVSPASGVVPFGYVCRYTDSLNYWEVRVLPNTAGNDLQIIQVTAGVETTRAEADVDWTSDDTDELMVDCRGSTISTAYRKAGAGVWTAGPSYASATQGQTSPDVGVMLYEAGVGRLSGFEIRAL
jgi:hypothetical protein